MKVLNHNYFLEKLKTLEKLIIFNILPHTYHCACSTEVLYKIKHPSKRIT